jgi:hypothetical protein
MYTFKRHDHLLLIFFNEEKRDFQLLQNKGGTLVLTDIYLWKLYENVRNLALQLRVDRK